MNRKYSITLSSFKDIEPLKTTLEAMLGFDAVEIYCEPDSVDVGSIIDLFHLAQYSHKRNYWHVGLC